MFPFSGFLTSDYSILYTYTRYMYYIIFYFIRQSILHHFSCDALGKFSLNEIPTLLIPER